MFDKLPEYGWRIRFHCSSSDSFDSDHEHTQFNIIIFVCHFAVDSEKKIAFIACDVKHYANYLNQIQEKANRQWLSSTY